MNTHQRIRVLIDKLVTDGEAVISTKWRQPGNWVGPAPCFVELADFETWRARCRLLATLLGSVGEAWRNDLNAKWNNSIENAISTQSILKAIQVSAGEGFLLEIEDLVLADAFANLHEQAVYLLEQGYFLAAGVIFRAILEERLRRLCDQKAITLTKSKPTLNDYNSELYKSSVYDKITLKQIEHLTAIGNDAAHNEPSLSAENVSQLREGVTRILEKFAS